MTASERINDYFNGKGFMLLSALALAAVTVISLALGVEPSPIQGRGIFFTLKEPLIDSGPLSATLNLLCLLATGFIMLALNKVFSFVRSMTHLFASAFFLLQTANPSGLVAFNAGTLLCLATAVALLPLFTSYQDKHAQRSIFLIFALVATGSMFHYGFLVLLPAFLLGFLNMGVLNLKGLLAMLFGLVTPFWIALGMGIVSPAEFVMPRIAGIWEYSGDMRSNLLILLAGITAVIGIIAAVLNLMTIMNYRLQTRVYNAFFIFVLAAAVIALCIDHNNVAAFLPLLNLMVAVQIAHLHTLCASRAHRYVFILLFIVGCLGFAATSLVMP